MGPHFRRNDVTYVLRIAILEALERYSHTLFISIQSGPTAVPRVYRRVNLNGQQPAGAH